MKKVSSAVGNHEYARPARRRTSSFRARAGDPQKGYYAYDLVNGVSSC